MSMLTVNNISITFNAGTPNEVKALENVSLDVEEGCFVTLLGTNGSGKSTLLNMIAGNIFPDKGKIILDEIDISRMAENRRAKYIGRVFQNPFLGTAPDMSISENLSMAAQRGKRRGLGGALNNTLLEEFRVKIQSLNMDLEDRLDSPIGKLSGGQRQALTLLMATWRKPKLLLLDEHTAALDPRTAAKVIQLTEEIIKKEKQTTLMVTHSMQQAVNMGDRIIMMHQGKIAYDFKGMEKKRLKVPDLLALFDEIRHREQIDISVAQMLEDNYV